MRHIIEGQAHGMKDHEGTVISCCRTFDLFIEFQRARPGRASLDSGRSREQLRGHFWAAAFQRDRLGVSAQCLIKIRCAVMG
jgi:hypothetical protein